LDIVVIYIREACAIKPVVNTKLTILVFVCLLKNKIKHGIKYKIIENSSNAKYSISNVCSKNQTQL
jgi:hypothetical protein